MIKHVILPILLLVLSGCGNPSEQRASNSLPARIISLAPNITETIFALGLEDNLVGATTYCTYPDAALAVSRIGGFGQVNYEAIVSLKPDLVILHQEYEEDKKRLKGLNIPYLETGSYFISDILDTIKVIGKRCGAEKESRALLQKISQAIDSFESHADEHPLVLITFSSSGDDVEQVHAFGTECLHNELLELAGGKNVVQGKLPYSTLSREALLRLNPDIIIELAPGQPKAADPVKAWRQLDAINAVKHGQVYQLTGDYTCIPGPRFIQTLKDFSDIIGDRS